MNGSAREELRLALAELSRRHRAEMLRMLDSIGEAQKGPDDVDPGRPTYDELDAANQRVYLKLSELKKSLTEEG